VSDHPALIAGGGISGLATALALSKAGIASRILERRPEFSEAGAGIQIGPNGTQILRQLGVADRLAGGVGVPRAIDVRDGKSAATLTKLPLGAWIEGRHGAPYWTVHRADLHAALLATARAAPHIEFSMNFDVSRLVQTETSVTVSAADGRQMDGPYLIGADGVGSTVRRLAISDLEMQPAGRVAARTVIPADAVPARAFASDVTLWLAPHVHVVHYPVRAGREIAVVVVSEDHATPEGWGSSVDAAAVLAKVAGLAPTLVNLLRCADTWRQWTLLSAPRLARWSIGRVALLGDATGPFFPFLAQGGVMALEDAAAVAKLLQTSPDHRQAFKAFEASRRPRRERMIATAERNGRIYHLDGPLALARNLMLRAMPGERVMAGYDWLYGHRA